MRGRMRQKTLSYRVVFLLKTQARQRHGSSLGDGETVVMRGSLLDEQLRSASSSLVGRCFVGCLRETRVPELDRESFLHSPAGGVEVFALSAAKRGRPRAPLRRLTRPVRCPLHSSPGRSRLLYSTGDGRCVAAADHDWWPQLHLALLFFA